MKRKPLDLKCMPNITNIRKEKPSQTTWGSTGSILVRTTGLVVSNASVIAKRANLFAEVKRQLHSVQGHTRCADNALHCHKSCRKLRYKKTNRINGSFLFALVRTTGLEPAQPCDHKNLNLTRLPIPPCPHNG